MPVIGFLRSTRAGPFAHLVVAFRQGLKETGYVEGENLRIEYRWADNDIGQLPRMAAELVGLKVDAIVCNSQAALILKRATATIPVVFVTGGDPVSGRLVTNLGRPGGNLTGLTFFGSGNLAAKRLGPRGVGQQGPMRGRRFVRSVHAAHFRRYAASRRRHRAGTGPRSPFDRRRAPY